MNNFIASIALGTLIFVPFSAFAGPIIRTGESVSIDATQSLKGDFYGFGSSVILSGDSENDAYIAGGTVTINAPVSQDLTILGGAVQVHGDVGDDLRVVGGEVTIAKPVKGDVVVLSDTLTILSTASVEGDVLFMGNTLTIEGEVVGGIHGTANVVRINAGVGGDVLLEVAERFSIGDKAEIQGAVTYESAQEVLRAQDAVVKGELRRVDVRDSVQAIPAVQLFGYMLGIVLFVTLSLFMISRRQVVQNTIRSYERVGAHGLIGIGMLVTVPFVAVLLCASVLGLIAGAILIFGYVLLLLISLALTPIFFGYVFQQVVLRRNDITLTTLGIGALLCIAVGFIPYVGGLLLFSGMMITFGALGAKTYRTIRS